MLDLFWQLKDTEPFTVYMTAIFAAAVFWFIREIVGAPMLALFSVPILMAGGILSPLVFQSLMIMLCYDKDANVAATTGVGVLAALVLVVTGKWLWLILKERSVRNTKIVSGSTARGA